MASVNKNMILTVLFLHLCLLFSASTQAFAVNDISIISLISNPSDYHNKQVRIIGVASVDYEWQEIFVSMQDAEMGITKNALRILLTEKDISKYRKYHMKYVLIEGIYDGEYKGFANSYSGAIREITRFEEWRPIRK